MRCIDDLRYFPELVFAYYVDGFFEYLANGVPDDEDLGVRLAVFLSVMEDRRLNLPRCGGAPSRSGPTCSTPFPSAQDLEAGRHDAFSCGFSFLKSFP